MNKTPFDLLSQRLALATSRRASLLSLGGAGVAAITGLSLTEAGKTSKKRKKNKKDNKKCQRQVGQCNAYFAPLCEDENAPAGCAEQIGECCAFLGTCQAEAFIDCLMTIMRPPRPENP
jgi:hypothetical protein